MCVCVCDVITQTQLVIAAGSGASSIQQFALTLAADSG